MDVFETVLRESVDRAQHALLLARQGEQQGEEYQHVVRLLDLLDRAQANHVDTTSWVAPSVLAVLRASAGEGA